MSFVAIGLFILACGWNFYSQFHPTKASALRNEGHPQYFGAALSAGYIIFLAIFLHSALEANTQYSSALNVIAKLAPENKDEASSRLESDKSSININQVIIESSSITKSDAITNREEKNKKNNQKPVYKSNYKLGIAVAFWSAVLGAILAWVLNWPFRFNGYLGLFSGYKSINNVEKTLVDASFNQASIAITLTSGKVYVGLPKEFDPNGPEVDWISIWPLASGYRKDDGTLDLNTSYSEAYDQIESNGDEMISPNDFIITIPLEHVISIQSFKLHFYVNHFSRQNIQGNEASDQNQEPVVLSNESACDDLSENNNINESKPISVKQVVKSNEYGLPSIGIPFGWLKFLQWTYHLSITAAIVLFAFSIFWALFFLVLAGVSLYFLSDSVNEKLADLIEAAKNI